MSKAKYIMVVLFYPDISNFTFWNVKNLKCKIFLIDFLDELGNFTQKNFYTSKCNFFLHFTTTDIKNPNSQHIKRYSQISDQLLMSKGSGSIFVLSSKHLHKT